MFTAVLFFAYGYLGLAAGVTNQPTQIPTPSSTKKPTAIATAPPTANAPLKAVSIEAGAYHTCALLNNAMIKCWGENRYGKLGIGDTKNRGDNLRELGNFLPLVALGEGRTVKSVSCGYHHTCAVLDNGKAKCWGKGGDYALGQPDSTTNIGDNPGGVY